MPQDAATASGTEPIVDRRADHGFRLSHCPGSSLAVPRVNRTPPFRWAHDPELTDSEATRLFGTAPEEMSPDTVFLRDHIRLLDVGAFADEKHQPQRVRFNVVMALRSRVARADDDVDRVLSYDCIVEAIDHVLAGERADLLETLAERIADGLLGDDQVAFVRIRIEKLDRVSGALGVEIVRHRREWAIRTTDNTVRFGDVQLAECPDGPSTSVPERSDPLIVFLSNRLLQSDELPVWLAAIRRRSSSAILCLDQPSHERPVSDHVDADLRIALLAIEQNAWMLAPMDRDSAVVGSRTELESRIREGRTSIWAPARLAAETALDCMTGDGNCERHLLAPALAAWLAGHMSISSISICGDGPERAMSLQAAFRGIRIRIVDCPEAL